MDNKIYYKCNLPRCVDDKKFVSVNSAEIERCSKIIVKTDANQLVQCFLREYFNVRINVMKFSTMEKCDEICLFDEMLFVALWHARS